MSPRVLEPDAFDDQATARRLADRPPAADATERVRGPAARPSRPPRPVIVCWALAVAAGAALIGVTGAHHLGPGGDGRTVGLAPSTVAGYLTAAAGPDAHDVRINGVYGSGHEGAWQFVAHLSWRDGAGRLESATTQLPQQAGTNTPDPSLIGGRLADEQRIGWTPSQLNRVLAADRDLDRAGLASLELQTADTDSTLTTCIATPVSQSASPDADPGEGAVPSACATQRLDGSQSTFADMLRDAPAGGPLSVQRDGHRITE